MVGVGCRVDPTVVIIRLSQPSLAGVGAGAELGNRTTGKQSQNF